MVLGTGNTFANAGDLSPGGANAAKTTTLTGNFQNFITDKQGTAESGAFTVTIGPSDSSDLLTVTGTAELGGTVRVVGAYEDIYTILTATGGFTRTFEEVMDTLFMEYDLDYYTTNTVKLTSERKEGVSFREVTGVTGTANQQVVAGILDSLESTDLDDPVVQAFLSLATAEEVRAGSNAISGEVHASLKGALMDTSQRQVAAVNNRLAARSGNPDSQTSDARTSTAAFGNPSSLADRDSGSWITRYGAWGETDSTPGTARMETDLRGVLFGVDHALGDHWRLGVLGGISQTDMTQRALLSSASVDTWSAGLYGGAEASAWGLDFGAIHNWHAVDTSRTVSFTNYSPERLSARYDARSWQLFAEAGHKVQVGGLMLEPFAGVSHNNLAPDGFSETGGDAALTSSSGTDNTTFTTLGLRSAMQVDDMIHLSGMAGWQHAFGDTDPSSTHTLSGSSAFTVTGAPTAKDALIAEFGIEAGLLDNAFLGVPYKGQYGDGAASHGFNAGLRVTFSAGPQKRTDLVDDGGLDRSHGHAAYHADRELAFGQSGGGIIAVEPAALAGVHWCHGAAVGAEDEALEERRGLRPGDIGANARALLENVMELVPQRAGHDGLVLAGVAPSLVNGLADIDPVVDEPVEGALVDQPAALDEDALRPQGPRQLGR